MKKRFAVPALAAFLMVPAVWAQTGAAPAAAAPVRWCMMGRSQLHRGRETSGGGIQPQFAPRQTGASNLQKQMEDIQTRLRRASPL